MQKAICTYDEMMDFITETCDGFAEQHAKVIAETLEDIGLHLGTPFLILDVFKALYENNEYLAITQLVMFFYDYAEEYYPLGIRYIQDYDVGLMPYCDNLMKYLDREMSELEERMPD